ncbi:Hypothetical predicted protein [Mytilus galloprovincialis]|uniref:Uncharacterized protein n=1 Tax=Mytilus galloprovincialis TaxID=29158 RepID=A0A8B6E6K7_MYTGA|nr:Hypothetical predicted protein [Mytilus galloprovincialis]
MAVNVSKTKAICIGSKQKLSVTSNENINLALNGQQIIESTCEKVLADDGERERGPRVDEREREQQQTTESGRARATADERERQQTTESGRARATADDREWTSESDSKRPRATADDPEWTSESDSRRPRVDE